MDEDGVEEFLLTWDGVVEPVLFWDAHLSTRTSEFIGYEVGYRAPRCPHLMSADLTARPGSDRYGEFMYPVGYAACLRIGCQGCCYCRKQPKPPVRLDVREYLPAGCVRISSESSMCDCTMVDGVPYFYDYSALPVAEFQTLASLPRHHHARNLNTNSECAPWMTLADLRYWIAQHSSGALGALPNSEPGFQCAKFHACVPHYLLERPGYGARATGGVLCVPGAVRNFVSAEELEAWAEALRECNMHLQILRGGSDEYRPDADELELRDAHLWMCAEEIAEREAWLRQRMEEERAKHMLKQIEEERAVARASTELRAQQRWSCQLICDTPRVKRDIRVGDMIRRDAGGREVAIVSRLATLATSGPSIPTGACDLLLWNASDREWSTPMFDVSLSTLDLLPLCCGRARCAVLREPPYSLSSDKRCW